MGIWAKIFGSDKVIEAGINGIDKAFYTAEERTEDDLKRINLHMAFLKLYEPFKIAQRMLAFMTGIPFIGIHVILLLNWLGAMWASLWLLNGEQYDFLVKQLAMMAEVNNETLGFPFALTMGFYFAGGAVEGAISKYVGVKNAEKKK